MGHIDLEKVGPGTIPDVEILRLGVYLLLPWKSFAKFTFLYTTSLYDHCLIQINS